MHPLARGGKPRGLGQEEKRPEITDFGIHRHLAAHPGGPGQEEKRPEITDFGIHRHLAAHLHGSLDRRRNALKSQISASISTWPPTQGGPGQEEKRPEITDFGIHQPNIQNQELPNEKKCERKELPKYVRGSSLDERTS